MNIGVALSYECYCSTEIGELKIYMVIIGNKHVSGQIKGMYEYIIIVVATGSRKMFVKELSTF